MIDVVHLTQHYGVRPVLRDVSLQIEPGQIVSILGPNGMGKSTLLSAIAGVLSPQAGYVEIDGLRRRRSVEEELKIRQRVAWLPDHPWLPKQLTGRQYLLAVAELYGVADDARLSHAERLLELFDMARQGDWPIDSYSNGQKHKTAICAALISDTPILLLDEPFAGGLDPAGILALKRVLKHLAERGRTVVMTTPVPELLEELDSRLVILRDGQIVAFDRLEGLRRLAGTDGNLAEVLQRLIYPETLAHLEQYFRESP